MRLIKAPNEIPDSVLGEGLVFLAGSIENGKAQDWQAELTLKLATKDVVILNPRREKWDPNWPQDANFKPFNEQVNWELDAMEKANLIVMYFDKDTQSPITLLEFGLYARSGKLIVCCPKGFWKKGNIDVTAKRYGVGMVESLDELAEAVIEELKL